MCFMNTFYRNKLNKLFFSCQGCFGSNGEAYARGNPEYVGVYGHVWLLVHHRSNHVGGFPAHAGQLNKFFHGERNFSLKLLYQHFRHADKVFGFVVGVRNTFDEGKQLVEARF